MFDDILHWQLLLLAVLQVSLLSVDVVAVATTAIESETTTLTRGQQQKRRETDKLHNLLRTWNIEQTILCCHG